MVNFPNRGKDVELSELQRACERVGRDGSGTEEEGLLV